MPKKPKKWTYLYLAKEENPANAVVVGRGFLDSPDSDIIVLRPGAGSWAGRITLPKKRLAQYFDTFGTLVWIPGRRKIK